jgi:hypothetical protein
MSDRRTKILTTALKKAKPSITKAELDEELSNGDQQREKIINRISS